MAQNIVHLVSSLMVGGAEKFVCGLAKQQVIHGHSVTIISFGCSNDPFQLELADSKVKIINICGSLFSRSLQLVQLRHFEIIHIHSPAVIKALVPILPVLISKKCFYTIHGEVDPPQSLLKLSHKLALVYLKRCSAVSEAARKSVANRYGWKSQQIKVIPNGIEIPKTTLKNTQININNNLRLGIVSRFIPLKNIALLFNVLASLPEESLKRIELHLFGDGPLRYELEILATGLPKLKKIFYGNVSDDKLIYPSFDVLVMCSDSEGLPMSIIEAMGYAKPVIATNVGAIPSLVIPEQTGWLYSPRDAQMLKEILNSCLLQPTLLLNYGQKALYLVKQQYSIDAVAKQFMHLYLDN
ncbi:MAG: glycosyltransferase family 4 protein [Paraglaciecola sp.]|nr:glycosyltransferase family 4 protein [Paraglaciecola sp.]